MELSRNFAIKLSSPPISKMSSWTALGLLIRPFGKSIQTKMGRLQVYLATMQDPHSTPWGFCMRCVGKHAFYPRSDPHCTRIRWDEVVLAIQLNAMPGVEHQAHIGLGQLEVEEDLRYEAIRASDFLDAMGGTDRAPPRRI